MKRFTLKRISAFVLAVIMTLSLCPITALAEMIPETYEASDTYVYEGDLGYTDEEVFAAYVQREVDKSLGYETPGFYSTNALEEGTLGKQLYDALKAELAKIASGVRTDTSISVEVNKTFTKDELGIMGEFVEDGYLTQETANAISGMFQMNTVYECLLADCPLELYWHDKTIGVKMPFSASCSSEEITIGAIVYQFAVAKDYAADGVAGAYVTDGSKTGATSTAIDNAAAIVAANASKSDLEKLAAYKNAICEAVSYNDTAAESSSSAEGINPWQMIWVFDGDATTNVVCEGYAKAFQYLCDLTDFSGNIECHTVSGYMTGGTGAGAHMWNVVTMDDGKNYLVDVTNCDDDDPNDNEMTIGYPDKLFIAYTTNSANENKVHTFTVNGTNVVFTYDTKMYDLFCDGYLALSTTEYVVTNDDGEGEYIPLYWSDDGGATYNNGIEKPFEQPVLNNGRMATIYVKSGGDYIKIDKATFGNDTITKLSDDLGSFSWGVNGDGEERIFWNTMYAVEGTESGVVFNVDDVQYLIKLTVRVSTAEEAAAIFANNYLYDSTAKTYYTTATFDNARYLYYGKTAYATLSAERQAAVCNIVSNAEDLLTAGNFIWWTLHGNNYNGQHFIEVTNSTSDGDILKFVSGYKQLWENMTDSQKAMVNAALVSVGGQYTVDELYATATAWKPLSYEGITIYSTCVNGELGYDVPEGYDGMYLDSVNYEPLIAVVCRPIHDKTVYLVSDEPLYVDGVELPKNTNPAMVDGATVYCLTVEGMNVGPAYVDVTVGDTGTTMPFLFSFDGVFFKDTFFYTSIEDNLWNDAPKFSYEDRYTCDDLSIEYLTVSGAEHFYLNVPYVPGEGKTLYIIPNWFYTVTSMVVTNGTLYETDYYTFETVNETVGTVEKYFKLTLSEDLTEDSNVYVSFYNSQNEELGGVDIQFHPEEDEPAVEEARWCLTNDTSGWNDLGTLAEAMAFANSLEEGTTYIELLCDVTIDEPLVFAEGTSTIFDLKGYTIDRGLSNTAAAEDEGNVIVVFGELVLCDESIAGVVNQGKITGGNAYFGGGVYVWDYGTFVMNGGVITGNVAAVGGGGVYVSPGGSFTMAGGAITENIAAVGGGVCASGGITVDNEFVSTDILMIKGTISGNTANAVYNDEYDHYEGGLGGGVYLEGATLRLRDGVISENSADFWGGGVCANSFYWSIEGEDTTYEEVSSVQVLNAPYVYENAADEVASNVYLFGDSLITVAGALIEDATVGVTVEDGMRTFTTGGADYAENFSSDVEDYVVKEDGSGNLKLASIWPALTYEGDNEEVLGAMGVLLFTDLQEDVLTQDISVIDQWEDQNGINHSAILFENEDEGTVYLGISEDETLTVSDAVPEKVGTWTTTYSDGNESWDTTYIIYKMTVDKPANSDTAEYTVMRSWNDGEDAYTFTLHFDFAPIISAEEGYYGWYDIKLFSDYDEVNNELCYAENTFICSDYAMYVLAPEAESKTIYFACDADCDLSVRTAGSSENVAVQMSGKWFTDGVKHNIYKLTVTAPQEGDTVTYAVNYTMNNGQVGFAASPLVFDFSPVITPPTGDPIWTACGLVFTGMSDDTLSCDKSDTMQWYDEDEEMEYLYVACGDAESYDLYLAASMGANKYSITQNGEEVELTPISGTLKSDDYPPSKIYQLTVEKPKTGNTVKYVVTCVYDEWLDDKGTPEDSSDDELIKEIGYCTVIFDFASDFNETAHVTINGVQVYTTNDSGKFGYRVPATYDELLAGDILYVPCRPGQDKTLYLLSDEFLYMDGEELTACSFPTVMGGKLVYMLTAEAQENGTHLVNIAVGDPESENIITVNFHFFGVVFNGLGVFTATNEDVGFTYDNCASCDGLSVEKYDGENFGVNVPFTIGQQETLYLVPNNINIASVAVADDSTFTGEFYTLEEVVGEALSTGYDSYYVLTLKSEATNGGVLTLTLYDESNEEIGDVDICFEAHGELVVGEKEKASASTATDAIIEAFEEAIADVGNVENTIEGVKLIGENTAQTVVELQKEEKLELVPEQALGCDESDKQSMMEKADKSGVVANVQYFDITVALKNTETKETVANVTETKEKLLITIELSEEMWSAYEGGMDILVMRVHEGVTDFIEALVDEINKTVSFESNKFSSYAVMAMAKGDSVTVSGTVTSYLKDSDTVTIELFAEGAAEATYRTTVTGNTAEYSIGGVAAGTYTMKVSKANHVTREYEVVVGTEAVAKDVKICPKGDVNLDGEVNADDLTALARHVAKIEILEDSYALLCSDVDDNGTQSADDLTKLARYVAKIINTLE